MESLSAMPPSSVKYCYFGWKADSSLDSGITYVLRSHQKAINLAPDAFHQRKKHDRVALRKKMYSTRLVENVRKILATF